MRFNLPQALARRIAHGDLAIDHDGPDYFLRYDKIEVAMGSKGVITVSLMAGNACIAYLESNSFAMDYNNTLQINGLEGRMKISANDSAIRPWSQPHSWF